MLKTFGSEAIALKFEQEEIDGRVLLSTTIKQNQAMEKLGLDTIGKKGKFLDNINKLSAETNTGKLTLHTDSLSCVVSLSLLRLYSRDIL